MEGLELEPATLLKIKEGKLEYNKPEMTITVMEQELLEEQKKRIISARYNDKTAGYPGIAKIIEIITRDFLWKGLRKDVEEYVKNCDTCHKTKHARYKLYGLLQLRENTEKV